MVSDSNNENKVPNENHVIPEDEFAKKHGSNVDDLDVVDHSFGCFFYKPRCLQNFSHPRWFLFWFCWTGSLQGMTVNGLLPVVLTTLEQRFSMSSSESGLIASCYDIASVICGLPVSYIGATRNKPRFLSVGMVLMGAGAFIFSLPHFITDYYSPPLSNTSEHLCDNTSMDDPCVGKFDLSFNDYKYAFYFGTLLVGAGSSSFYTLGIAFLDDNVRPKVAPVYLGVFYMMVIVGPAVGFLAGGYFLSVYVDSPGRDPAEFNLTPSSSAWIGAWWIGFFLCSFLCWIGALPLFGMPRDLPGAEQARSERICEVHKKGDEEAVARPHFGKSYKDVPKAFKNLMLNPTFMFINFAGATEGMLVGGFTVFLPKYVEVQYMMTASAAAIIMGLIVIPAGGGSSFLSGWLVKRFKMSCQDAIRFCWVVSFTAIFACFAFLIRCKQGPVAGFTDINSTTGKEEDLARPCNMDCLCTEATYNPICGNDGISYYSPCYAGCETKSVDEDEVEIYGDCACIQANATCINGFPAEAVNHFCEPHCVWELVVCLVLLFVVIVQTFGCTMPALSATIRSVAPKQRSFAIGNQWIYVRCLGTIPAPLLFGWIFDLSCQQWSHSCNEDSKGSCHFYDNHKMTLYMFALAITLKFFSTLFFFLAWWLYKPPVDHSKLDNMSDNSSTAEKTKGTVSTVCKDDSSYLFDSDATFLPDTVTSF